MRLRTLPLALCLCAVTGGPAPAQDELLETARSIFEPIPEQPPEREANPITGEDDKITAFMHALTGEQPQVAYPILPPSVATTPRPQP